MVLGPPRRRKVSKRAPQRFPKGSLREAKTGKNMSREGLKIHLVSQVRPERAPRCQGGLRGVPFGSFLVTLLGSCVTVSPSELVRTNAKQCAAMQSNATP